MIQYNNIVVGEPEGVTEYPSGIYGNINFRLLRMSINIFDGVPKIKSVSKANFYNFSELRSRFEEIGDQVF